jgi:hypothetical protein
MLQNLITLKTSEKKRKNGRLSLTFIRNLNLLKKQKEFLSDRGCSKIDVENWKQDEKQKLIRIMSGDRTSHKYMFLAVFQEFISKIPSWYKDIVPQEINLFWQKFTDSDQENFLVMRHQISSNLCYMHAPVVLQHYLLSIYRLKNKIPLNFEMIDISLFINKHWKGQQLDPYFSNFCGDSSILFLHKITKKQHIKLKYYNLIDVFDNYNKKNFDKTCSEIFNRLESEPALVSCFNVAEAFHDSNDVSFCGKCDLQNSPGLHSMLLIG